MTIMAFPSKENPKAYRVQDKRLREQVYCWPSEFGSLAAAKLAAEKKEKEFQSRRKARALRMSLDINQIFHEDGRVRGLRRGTRRINGQNIPMLIVQITVNGKQIKTDRRLINRTFRDAYHEIQNWILARRGIERTYEITKMFKQVEPIYQVAPHDQGSR
ncbi:hypothetical protein ABRZ80_20490 [Vibrio vulnificus]|uniref:hypothetical protein n=1 Tax=Vibrio vulnificus TaxID=672 RepID=UPI0032EE6DCA